MKFGKLPDVSNVVFDLPPDPQGTKGLLERLTPNLPAQLYIGCTGWSMKEWVGKTYPKGTKTKDYLIAYGKQFNTIELNTTHYRIPSPDMVTKWFDNTPDDFKFCPKIPQTISHRKELGLTDGSLEFFCDSIRGLRHKLGCCFIQFPPYVSPSDLPRLRLFLERFPQDIDLAIELRHEDWFQNDNFERIAELLEKHNKSTVITDVAGRRDVLHNRLTSHIAMIRFVGNGLHPTDYTRLDSWIQKIKDWTESGISEIYFFPHEPDNILAPDAVEYFANAAQKYLNVKTRGPTFTDENEGEQLALF